MTKLNYLSIKTFHGNEFGVCALFSIESLTKVDSIQMRRVIAVVVVAVQQCFLFHFNGIFSLSFYASSRNIDDSFFSSSVAAFALSRWIYFIPDDENEWFGRYEILR